MARIVLLNKPFQVLCQFRAEAGAASTSRESRLTLAHFVDDPALRIAGRLDYDSEGLVLLTDDGIFNARLTQPDSRTFKTYWVQVDGVPSESQLQTLRGGVLLKDGMTLPARVAVMDEPEGIWPRNPPIRYRASLPTSWLSIEICEGRNRQVRRMTAAVGLPTLRLIRMRIGDFELNTLAPGETRTLKLPAHRSTMKTEKPPETSIGSSTRRKKPSTHTVASPDTPRRHHPRTATQSPRRPRER